MATWLTGTVVAATHFTDTLFSLKINVANTPFIAGQFVKLALTVNGDRIARAYSIVSAPQESLLEFYIAKVAAGKLTAHLHQLNVNDTLMVSQPATGYFTLKEVPDAKILWLLATGTGIAPYLSMLQDGQNLDRFNKIVLVHGVRFIRDLSYLTLMQTLAQRYPAKLYTQPIISRETHSGALFGRIPALLANGQLEKAVGLTMTRTNSQVMLCGNPDMITDTQNILKTQKDMQKNLRRKPGQFTSELYW